MNKSTSRWLAVSLLVVIVMILVFALLLPLVLKAVELKSSTEDLAFKIKRYERVLARKDGVYENVENLTAQFQQQGYFYNQPTEALASAALQGAIKTTIANAGGQMTSTQNLPSKTKQGFTQISVKVRMSGNMTVLRNVLYQLETAVPFLVIEQLDIRPEFGKRNRKTRKVEATGMLNVNFQVLGFIKAAAQ